MKIGIFDPYLDDLGGGEKYMAKIAECLSLRNDVSVFWDNGEDVKELLNRFSLDLSKVSFVKNIFSPKVPLLKRLYETKKFDLLILLSDGSIPFSLSKKLLIHIQQPLSVGKISLKTRLKISRISKVFCNSYYSKSYVDKNLNVKSFVLYPPVEIKAKKVKKENIILHVGRFRIRDVQTSYKGVNMPVIDYKKQGVMIRTFGKMVKDGLRDYRFLLAVSVKDSESKIFESFKKEADRLPIEFLVNKANDQLWDIYSKAKIYWHASGFGEDLIKHPEYAEHFGISTVEAMGAGAVPVVINAGGQKEIVENGKNGYLWNTTEELEQKTMRLINERELWNKMSEESVKRAKIFTGDRFCRELKEIIKT